MKNTNERITSSEILIEDNARLGSDATINKPSLNLKNAKKILQKNKEANTKLETQKNKPK